MSFEITGKLVEVGPVTVVSDKFRKREFVIEKSETRTSFEQTDYLKFQLVQDKCNLADLLQKGEIIKVFFNLRGRKWEKNGTTSYFTNLEAWKIEKMQTGNSTDKDINADAEPFPASGDIPSAVENFDDLPF